MSSVTSSLVFDPTETADGSNVGAYVRAGSDGDLIASQTIAAEEWLNVAAALHAGDGTAITQTGGALDVNVASVSISSEYAEDSAHTTADIGQFIMSVRVDDLSSVPAGALAGTELDYQALITDAQGALFVAGVDFDIRALSSGTDSVAITDGGGSITVDATDLDIRDLTAASDSVAAWLSDGAGNALSSTGGSLDVNVTNTIDLDDDLADTAIENTATAVSTTAVNVVSSALAGRKHLFLANLGNKALYFGKTGVTAVNGYPLFPREKIAARVGPSVAPQIIGATGASAEDLRVMELA